MPFTVGGPWGICSMLWHSPPPTPGPGGAWTRTGWPMALTRAETFAHWTFTQGWGFVPPGIGIWKRHPTTGRAVTVATGMPVTWTRGADESTVAGARWK